MVVRERNGTAGVTGLTHIYRSVERNRDSASVIFDFNGDGLDIFKYGHLLFAYFPDMIFLGIIILGIHFPYAFPGHDFLGQGIFWT